MGRNLALVALLVCASCAPRDGLDLTAMMDPQACASCHPEAFREWSGSMHAASSDDPVFQGLVRLGQDTTGGALGSLCAGCHAPAALAAGATVDATNIDEVPRYLRGVTCWACHAIDGVTALHNGGLTRTNESVVYGGIVDPLDTPAHRSEPSGLLGGLAMESSDACGACHDVQAGDVPIEHTYGEWAGSLFGPSSRTPVSCASCHMLSRDGVAADVPDAPPRRIHDHAFPGVDVTLTTWPERDAQLAGIARDLAPAISAKLCVTPGGGGAQVEVTLDNVEVGHSIPSGITHARRLWVQVVARSGTDELLVSGRFAPGEVVSPDNDPSLWVLRSHLYDADGVETPAPWLAASIESELLTPSVTNDPNDPRFYHARSRTWNVPGNPDQVDVSVHFEPLGLDALDVLIGAGYLDPAVRDRMPRHHLDRLDRTWRTADGWGCVP